MSTLNLDILLTTNAQPPVAVDADTTPVLSDAAGTFGVKREDTGAIVVNAYDPSLHPTSIFTRLSTGSYRYALANAIPGVRYRFAYKVVAGGTTQYVQKLLTATLGLDSDESYLTVSQGDAIVAMLPGLSGYKTAAGTNKAAALLLASVDVDNDRRYQGRRYVSTQLREFPRMAYQASQDLVTSPPNTDVGTVNWAGSSGRQIWDWDSENNVAVVPSAVLQAVVFQADAILAPAGRDERLQAIADGLIAQTTGPFQEQYKAAAIPSALCRRASMLMSRYVLKQGRLL